MGVLLLLFATLWSSPINKPYLKDATSIRLDRLAQWLFVPHD
jgi:hypothetical protein